MHSRASARLARGMTAPWSCSSVADMHRQRDSLLHKMVQNAAPLVPHSPPLASRYHPHPPPPPQMQETCAAIGAAEAERRALQLLLQ